MPEYNRGPCACCASHVCNPVSFEFKELTIEYQYSQLGNTWYTDCIPKTVVIEVTHADGTKETLDVKESFQYSGHYASNVKHKDNQGWVTVCGKTAQWRVQYNIPDGIYSYTATLADASSVSTSRFQ